MEDCIPIEGLSSKDKGKERSKVEDGDDATPKEGMTFNSLNDVRIFYNNYARQVGFGTKVRSTWRDEGEVRKCVIACVNEGKVSARRDASGHRELNANSKKMLSRVGCKARVNVRRDADGLWYITKATLEHNHMVSPSKTRYLRSNRRLDDWVKKQLEVKDTVGIPVCNTDGTPVLNMAGIPVRKSPLLFPARVGSIENLSIGKKDDARNYVEASIPIHNDVTKRPDEEVGMFACVPMDRYDDIYMHCREIAEIGSKSDMKYKLALSGIEKLRDELLAFHEEDPDNHPIGSVGHEETDSARIIDPNQVKLKDRPSQLRLQSTVEKVVNAKKKKLPVGKMNINQCDISLMQPSIQSGQQVNHSPKRKKAEI